MESVSARTYLPESWNEDKKNVEGGEGEGEKRKRLRRKPKNSLFSPSSTFLRSGQISRHNSGGPLATPASFHAETGLSALSDQPSKTKI